MTIYTCTLYVRKFTIRLMGVWWDPKNQPSYTWEPITPEHAEIPALSCKFSHSLFSSWWFINLNHIHPEDGGSTFPPKHHNMKLPNSAYIQKRVSSALTHLRVHCTLSPVLKSRTRVLPRWDKNCYMDFSSILAKATICIFPQHTSWSHIVIAVWQWDGFSELVQKPKEMHECMSAPHLPTHTAPTAWWDDKHNVFVYRRKRG